MGQQEVYDFLMKNPDSWYTSKQISEQLIVSIGSVTMSLKKLRKTNIIKFRNTGKRNTFQYMVQSEPAKLAERKSPMLEPQQQIENKVKVKIKPKIVHQHTYLSGQTFYGVIRPKEEVDAIERERQISTAQITAQPTTRKRVTRRAAPKKARARVRKAKGVAHRRVSKKPVKKLKTRQHARTTKTKKVVKRAKR